MATSAPQIKQGEGLITSQNQLEIVKQWGDSFNNLITTQQVSLTPKEREFGMSIITNLTDRCIQSGIKASELNMTNFLEQVKHCSKLQLSINEQELFLDIRNDKNTGLKTVKISRQYQGEEKLMMRYSTKKIVRFKKDIVCKGDIFETEEDFDLGLTRITKHIKNLDIDRNKFENIEQAYYIAYVEEYGKLVPYTVIVDKNRLVRARNAAQTQNVWNSDCKKMCLKSCAHEFWSFFKPYINFPVGLQESLVATEDEMNWDVSGKVNPDKTYDIDDKDEVVIDPNAESSLEGKEKDAVENDFVEVETKVETKDIWYSEYKDNKDKYEPVDRPDGSPAYNEETKKILVKLK